MGRDGNGRRGGWALMQVTNDGSRTHVVGRNRIPAALMAGVNGYRMVW